MFENLPSPPDSQGGLLEKHIQLFLSENLHLLGIQGLELVQLEHPVSVGRIDILAKSADECMVIIETKRGQATREDIGKIQSYMGAVQSEYPDAEVQGILVAAGLTSGAEAALVVVPRVDFFTFQLQFTFQRQKRRAAPVPIPTPAPPPLPHDAVIRTESRYCVYCRTNVVANVMGNGTGTCTRCRNVL